MDLEILRAALIERENASFHPINDWTPTDWATAFAGEAGEACNLIKKMRRGDDINVEDIADEVADTVIYAMLLCERLNVSLSNAIVRKFNEVSERWDSPVRLAEEEFWLTLG